MNLAHLERYLALYATESSANYKDEVFKRAIALHLEGSQSEAISLLAQLHAKHESDGLSIESFETQNLIILALVASGALTPN
jgi:hypothetical protein